jgi:hypothetical protein
VIDRALLLETLVEQFDFAEKLKVYVAKLEFPFVNMSKRARQWSRNADSACADG